MAPAVSVIIPTYQRREAVLGAVSSALVQTWRDFELIVVDDGSDDGSGEALARFGDRISYRWRPNAGPAAARNAGLAIATGEIVAFLDSDDRWLPDHLATVNALLLRHPEAVLASTGRDFRNAGRGTVSRARLVRPLPRLLIGNFVGQPSCIAVRRAAVVAAGGFDERLEVGEDAALWLRLALQGPFAFLRRRTVVRGRSSDSLEARARRDGSYLAAVELGVRGLLDQVGREDRLLRAARGSLRFAAALAALDGGDPRPALADACALLPELSAEPGLVLGRLALAVPGFAVPRRRLGAAAALADAWPDPRADSALRLRTAAIRAALEARRPRTALALTRRWAGLVTPRYLAGTPRRLAWRAGHAGDRLGAAARGAIGKAPSAPRPRRGGHGSIAETSRRGLLAAGARPILSRLAVEVHRALALAVGRGLRAGLGGDLYLRGGFGGGEPLPGVSDVDLVVVVPDKAGETRAARRLVQRRWRSLRRRLPPLAELVEVRVEDTGSVRSASAAPAHAHGLNESGMPDAALYSGRAAHARSDHLDERPGLYGPLGDWRPLRRAPAPSPATWEPPLRPVAAWLELQFWWTQAFGLCRHPAGPRAASSCVKVVAEAARIWLWLARGERATDRADALERALRALPEERDLLLSTLALSRALRRSPRPPLDRAMGGLVGLSQRVADWFAAETRRAGSTPVRLCSGERETIPPFPPASVPLSALAGTDGGLRLLPLVDWRARTLPVGEDAALAAVAGSPARPELVSALANAAGTGAYPVLQTGDLIVLPAASWWRGRLRAAQCAATDPVSFALLAGRSAASFPQIAGLSASDCARRAVAEHRGWLDSERAARRLPPQAALSVLLGAARAAFFLASVEEGAAELATTGDAVLDELAAFGEARAAEDTRTALRAARFAAVPPSDAAIGALRRAVERLPAYADAGRRLRQPDLPSASMERSTGSRSITAPSERNSP